MSQFIKISSFLLFFSILIWGLWHTELIDSTDTGENLANNWQADLAPDASFQLLDGSEKKLSDYQGKLIILNFWATWCAPCLEEFPEMLRIANQYPEKLVLIAISNDINKETIETFAKKHQKKFNLFQSNVVLAWDKNLQVSQKIFNVVRLPETFIIDQKFQIIRKIAGSEEWTSKKMESFLKDKI